MIDVVDSAPELDVADQAADLVARPLGGLQVDLPMPESQRSAIEKEGDQRRFYDLSGKVVISVLRAAIPEIHVVQLQTMESVLLVVQTVHGPMRIEFPRARVSASNPHQLLVLMVVVSLLMTLIAFIFLRNQLRPIRRLARAAEGFGKGQLLPYRPQGATEVRAAGAAFLEMRARIERFFEQRTLMLSGISHDLRTPLTRLRLGLSMLPPDEDVAAMERDVAEMGTQIDAFLAFMQGDAQETPPPNLAIQSRLCARLSRMPSVRGAGGAVTCGRIQRCG